MKMYTVTIKKTVNIVFPLFAVLCFSTPKSFKIPLQGLSEFGIRSFRSTVVLQSSQFVPQKSRSRYCVLIATLSQITFSDIKKIYIYTWLSGDLIATPFVARINFHVPFPFECPHSQTFIESAPTLKIHRMLPIVDENIIPQFKPVLSFEVLTPLDSLDHG